jgi:dCMP deaminase
MQVGTVITSTDYRKVLAVGYNGNATGLPNTCDRDEAGNCGCLHSEDNAVINCDSPRQTEKYVFVTHHPCSPCAKRLINLGNVKKVFYVLDYRSRAAEGLFMQAGIALERLELLPAQDLAAAVQSATVQSAAVSDPLGEIAAMHPSAEIAGNQNAAQP